MSSASEQAFLDAIHRNPEDQAAVLVYADWLEERGDGRAGYLRAQIQYRNAPTPETRQRLIERYPGKHLSWMFGLEQTGAICSLSRLYLGSVERLLNTQFVLSPLAIEGLDEFTRSTGRVLPAAITSWYSIENACKMIELDTDGEDVEYSPGYAENPTSWDLNVANLLKHGPANQRWWISAYDNCVGYAAELTDGDDPAVNCIETDGSIINGALGGIRFSSFIFERCWSKAVHERFPSFRHEQAQIGPKQLRAFSKTRIEGVHLRQASAPRSWKSPYIDATGDVIRFRYYFVGDDHLLRVESIDDPSKRRKEASLTVSAADEQRCDEVLTPLMNTLPPSKL